MAKVSINNLGDAINNILEEYGDAIQSDLESIKKKQAKETVKAVKANIDKSGIKEFRKTKSYKKSIGQKTQKELLGNSYIIHAKNGEHRLTHLLENGHIVKNKFGTYGRTRAFKHWEPAEQELIQRYTKEVEDMIEKK